MSGFKASHHSEHNDPEKNNRSEHAILTPPSAADLGMIDKEISIGVDASRDLEPRPVTPQLELAVQVEEAALPSGSNIVTWTSESDPANPMNWSAVRRWSMIIMVSLATFIAGLSSSMFAPAVPQLMEDFDCTNSVLGSFVITVFVLGLAMGPLVCAPLSELYGRLIVEHVGNIGFLVFTIACALGNSMSMEIVFRLLQGMFASVPLTNGGGLIADMIKQEKRGFALAMFTMGVLLGPVIGPVTGGFLGAATNWRWVFWVQSIPLGLLTVASFFVLRESYAPVLLARKATRLRRETGNPLLYSKYDTGLSRRNHFNRGIVRVVKMLMYSPIVTSLSIWNGLVYSYFYLLVTTLTPTFQSTYGFSSSIVGLSYLGLGFGFILGQSTVALYSDRILTYLTRRHGGEMKPEYRLPLSVIGGLLVPVAFFWYGWSVETRVHWIMPIIGTTFLGYGNSLIFLCIQGYSIDAYTIYAASALAANAVTRSVMAALLPLAAPAMYDSLGPGWGNSLLAFLAILMVPIPSALLKYGESMRGWNRKHMDRL